MDSIGFDLGTSNLAAALLRAALGQLFTGFDMRQSPHRAWVLRFV